MQYTGLSLILSYTDTNTYAFNVLLGAIETASQLEDVDVALAPKPDILASRIREALAKRHRVLVGWSFYSPQSGASAETLRVIRQEIPDPTVLHLAGGVHATAEPEQTLQAGFDLVAVGEGERTLVDLLTKVVRGDDYSGISGLAYRTDGRYVSNGAGERADLNDFPPFSEKHGKFSPIEITRGCIYACKFCQTPFMFKAKFRHRFVENVCHYVKIMKERGLTDVRFITPTGLSYGSQDESVNLHRVEELLASIREVLGGTGRIFFGTFPSEFRPEHVTPDALRVVRKYVANDNLIIGAQSGSQRVLDAIHRGHTVGDIVSATKAALEFGFLPNVDFIFGLPGETASDVQATLNLAERLSDMGARLHGHTFMPLPGTPFRYAPPGVIGPRAMRRLMRLESRTKLYGQWKQQISIAEDLAKIANESKRRHEYQVA